MIHTPLHDLPTGLYIPDEPRYGPYRGIGVRIEDDVLLTGEGCEVLSCQVGCRRLVGDICRGLERFAYATCSNADSSHPLHAACPVQAPVQIRDVEELAGSAAEEAAAAGRGTGLGTVGVLPLHLPLPLPPRFEGPLHRAFGAAPAADTVARAAAAGSLGSGPGSGAGVVATGVAGGRGTPERQRREARAGAGREAAAAAGTAVA